MSIIQQNYFFLILFSLLQLQSLRSQTPDLSQQVIINAYMLNHEDISQIKQVYGVNPLPGSYWYDSKSGAFGYSGGPVLGVMYPGHAFGQLSSDASHGTSGVFINGRQLQYSEAVLAARLFGYAQPVPGRYWLEANGNLGMEGYPMALGNIYMAMAQARRYSHGGGGDNFWSRGLYSGGNYYTGADGRPSQGYVSVPGYGPVSHGMN